MDSLRFIGSGLFFPAFADVEDLVRDVDYKPSTSVDEGIKAFADWYKEYYAK